MLVQGKSLPHEYFCHRFSSSSHASENRIGRPPNNVTLEPDRTWQSERPMSFPTETKHEPADVTPSQNPQTLSSPTKSSSCHYRRDHLTRRPAAQTTNEGVVSYERCDFAICACHEGTLLDTAGKVSNRNNDERPARYLRQKKIGHLGWIRGKT